MIEARGFGPAMGESPTPQKLNPTPLKPLNPKTLNLKPLKELSEKYGMARARLDFFHDLFQSFLPPNKAGCVGSHEFRIWGLGVWGFKV